MATSGYYQNGVKRKTRKRRKRNGTAARSTVKAKANSAKRRTISVASARAVLKRNGLKAVSRTAANPKRKRHHKRKRNGVTVVRSSRNGIFGNTKHDAMQVGSVVGGMAATKLISKIITPFAAPWAAKIGVGQYTELLVDAGVALMVVPFIAGKVSRNADVRKLSRLGGLVVVGIDAIDQFAPASFQSLNPFSSMGPIVVGPNGQAGVSLPAAKSIVNSMSAPAEEKAAVGMALDRAMLATGAINPNPGGANGGMNRSQILPMGNGMGLKIQ